MSLYAASFFCFFVSSRPTAYSRFFRLFRLVHVLFYSTPLSSLLLCANFELTKLLLFLTPHSTTTIETSLLLPFFFSLDSWFRRMRTTCNHHLYSCAGRSCRWTFSFLFFSSKIGWLLHFCTFVALLLCFLLGVVFLLGFFLSICRYADSF